MTAAMTGSPSQDRPGGTVTYSIWVWSTVTSRRVTANITGSGQAIDKPVFTLCPGANGRTCWIGSLPAYQAIELLVTDHVRKKATSGEQIGLTVVVQGDQSPSGGSLSPAEGTVSAVLGQPSSPPITITPPGSGSFPTTAAGLPGTTVTPGSISSLFPVVTPSPTPSASPTGHGKRRVTKVTTTASSLPLDPRLIGGQLAGLAVLAAAVTMVMARLSLRTPQLASAPQSGPAAAAAPPPQPSTEDAKTESGDTSEDSPT